MIRRIVSDLSFIGVALLAIALLCAQAPIGGFPPGVFSNRAALDAGVTYQGPGDIVSGAIAFYSCRSYTAAGAGGKAYRLVRASDSTQQDINSLVGGGCDTTTPATFCNATTCKFVTYYDQSGANNCTATACDVTQATDANRPSWTSAALNGAPCATGAGSQTLSSANQLSTNTQPYSFTGVAKRTGNTAGSADIIANAGAQVVEFLFRPTNTFGVSMNGLLSASAADNAFHAFVGVGNNASSAIVVDGVASTGTTGTGVWGPQAVEVMGSRQLTGIFCEAGIWPSAFNAAQYGNMNTNMHSANGWNF